MPVTTTLSRIRAHGPCKPGWEKLLKHLGKTSADDEALTFAVILESNGLQDTLWCMRAEPDHAKLWREFALWCARQSAHLTTDPRVAETLDVVQRYLDGEASVEELRAASEAARAASWAASEAARAASWAASEAASWAASWAASEAARAASEAASWAASEAASWAASEAASEAASWAASEAASWAASWAAQGEKLKELLNR